VRFLIEFDGPLVDVEPVYSAAYRGAIEQAGWSRIDHDTFWRLFRAKGRQADLLPGAKPAKVEAFWADFEARLDSHAYLSAMTPFDTTRGAVQKLAKDKKIIVVFLGGNGAARRAVLEKHGLLEWVNRVEAVPSDPRLRPAALRNLAAGDKRTIAVTTSDTLIRAANEAELVSVGLTCGPCAAPRLHRAGVGVVYASLIELVDSLRNGGAELAIAGLLPQTT